MYHILYFNCRLYFPCYLGLTLTSQDVAEIYQFNLKFYCFAVSKRSYLGSNIYTTGVLATWEYTTVSDQNCFLSNNKSDSKEQEKTEARLANTINVRQNATSDNKKIANKKPCVEPIYLICNTDMRRGMLN